MDPERDDACKYLVKDRLPAIAWFEYIQPGTGVGDPEYVWKTII